jgi:hypothetical protein
MAMGRKTGEEDLRGISYDKKPTKNFHGIFERKKLDFRENQMIIAEIKKQGPNGTNGRENMNSDRKDRVIDKVR